MSFSLEIQLTDPRWRKVRGLSARVTDAVTRALKAGKAPRNASLTILLTGDRQMKALNHDFRGTSKATNVLSFPAAPAAADDYLGDVVLAYGVMGKEARAGDKRLVDHTAHLVIHGVLHLLGFDHVTQRKANLMEALETKILAQLGIADPYAEEGA
ncbi:MAG: rRNA maturation RNase YbeY [Alphaproteobacteria bacterium]|nr:rRNA maturation RNase YbeY [Alphaproteobacteria bacterium]MBL6938907.1 rRNA maturation RNase YbeY [Alphaproteobacteria bacterium]MBL7099499.1 rRNA maturation RNase YbeY [Alphaproteobacteria bacterium]